MRRHEEHCSQFTSFLIEKQNYIILYYPVHLKSSINFFNFESSYNSYIKLSIIVLPLYFIIDQCTLILKIIGKGIIVGVKFEILYV